MSADGLTVVTLIFPGHIINGASFNQLNETISFDYDLPSNIQTLSSNNASPGNDLTGLLYLPLLNPGDSCNSIVPKFVPANVTTQNNLPNDGQIAFLAIAPWISPACTKQFLNAATNDALRAFIFYLPNNSTQAPPPSDASWDLGDGGAWKSSYKFPVYAIDGQSGAKIQQEMALYHGNLTTVPFGNVLAQQFPPTFYVRLAGSISVEEQNSLPSLWIFLLIVLGILIFIIGFTSCSMHVVQRRRRQLLRQRVASGEVDLEQLGIKRLTVPRSILDAMPLYKYPDVVSKEEYQNSNGAEDVEVRSASDPRVSDPEIAPTSPRPRLIPGKKTKGKAKEQEPYNEFVTAASQPTCAICLEDFVAMESEVRELPCRHIFHSECIDPFLGENSSLCPLCKKTSLPRGYCPPLITNAMVRRERMVRRMRRRDRRQQEGLEWWNLSSLFMALRRPAPLSNPESSGRRRTTPWPGWRARSRGESPAAQSELEMSSAGANAAECGAAGVTRTPTDVSIDPSSIPLPPSAPASPSVTFASRPEPTLPLPDESDEEFARSRWRRTVSMVWPGLLEH